jgi:hypothetical protein
VEEQRGGLGYTYKSDIYRPTVKVSKDTPTTFKELKPNKIKSQKGEIFKG